MAGDLGAVPESATLRYLTGLGTAATAAGADAGTYWVDAWDVSGIGPSTTTGPDNPWAARAAQADGVHATGQLPQRRTDYVLVRGWVYGRAGHPAGARRAFTTGMERLGHDRVVVSDHWGVEADLADPGR